MGLFGPSKHVVRLQTQTKDLRKDLSLLEENLEEKLDVIYVSSLYRHKGKL